MWPPGPPRRRSRSGRVRRPRHRRGAGGRRAGRAAPGCPGARRARPEAGGGAVIFEVDPGMATLLDLHRRPVRRARNGKQGSGSHRNGADGADLIVAVPDGTVVKTEDGEVLADLVGASTRYVAAQGGRGG